MGETQNWRLCISDKDGVYYSIVMKSHNENRIELKMDCVCVSKKKLNIGDIAFSVVKSF